MALLVPNVGEGRMLKAIVNHTAPENLRLRLFQSNTTPAEGHTAASYTEATFTGYPATGLLLTGASWTITEGDPSYATYAQQPFDSSADQASQSIYGYYVTQTTSGILMWAEVFGGGPYNIVNNGDSIKVTPYLELA
jgi:hypothetical protein